MKLTIPTTLLCLMIALAACKRVEVITPDESSLLPLTDGNRWVYIDSFFTETSIPSNDTFVRKTSYRIEGGLDIDYEIESGPDKGKIVRTKGWRLLNDNSHIGREHVFVREDTVFSTADYAYFGGQGKTGDCNIIDGALGKEPASSLSVTNDNEEFRPLVWENGEVGSLLSCYPAFMDLPIVCMTGLGPFTEFDARYEVVFPPLSPAGITDVIVPAGTFTCHNLGYQKWAEGVGMVTAELTGAGMWMNDVGQTRTGNLRWKRVLSSYAVN